RGWSLLASTARRPRRGSAFIVIAAVSCERSPNACSSVPAAALPRRRKPWRGAAPTTTGWIYWRAEMTQQTDRRGRKLNSIDREALGRALKLILGRPEREDPGRREQVERLLREEGWFVAADFCVYCCQMELVRPRLWQPVPSDITDIEGT